jgi:hypothetical protein
VDRGAGLSAESERSVKEAHGLGAADQFHAARVRVLDGGRSGWQP